jgi:DNA-binding response OmpR family regulator
MKLDGARVLVVEDNRDTSALLRDLLESEGYEVDAVATGEGALERLDRNPDVDLMVLDLMLPGMSGYEVIERLRAEADSERTPILVLSALGSPPARVRGLREGADDYMTKPFLPEELVARVRTLVTTRLLERRTQEIHALGQIAQASLTTTAPDALLQRMVEIAAEAFHAEAAAILLADETRHELRARAAVGMGDDLGALTTPIDAGVAGRALRARAPLLVTDDADLRRAGFQALVAAPLIVAGTAIGVVQIGRRSRRIDRRAEGLLQLVADRMAVAIEHARLETEARELADVVRRIGEGVVVTDAEDRIVFANRAFLEMVEAPAEALTGRPWTDCLSTAQDTGALAGQVRQPTFQGEFLLLRHGGASRARDAVHHRAQRWRRAADRHLP